MVCGGGKIAHTFRKFKFPVFASSLQAAVVCLFSKTWLLKYIYKIGMPRKQ